MSGIKEIKVSPDLFKISNNTRKQRPKTPKSIKVKSNKDTSKSIKRKLLSLIRNKQEEKIKEIKSTKPDVLNEIKGEFDDSLEFLNNLAKKEPQQQLNSTIKNRSIFASENNVPNELKRKEISDNMIVTNNEPIKLNIPQEPKYGCLKNGYLPTYRSWKNQTQKTYEQPSESYIVETSKEKLENASKINEYKQNQAIINENKYKTPTLKKKTIKRNYSIGRSKKYPKVSVLVSNNQMRKNITMKKYSLKQTPIHEVKKFLIKRGFIKVGSIAPNDVLRQMYETASMICGDVKNHNPDNLLYNYFNYNEE